MSSEAVRRLLLRFMPEPSGARYAIVRADGEIMSSNLVKSEEDRLGKMLAQLKEMLRPDEFTFIGGREETTLILRADERFFMVIRCARGTPGLMLSCARAIFSELRDRLEEMARPAGEAGVEAGPEAGAEVEGGPYYELDPRFSSVDEALDTLPPSLLARNIVANLSRPLTAEQIAAGLRSLGIEASLEEVLQALSYLETIKVVRKVQRA